MLCPNYPGDMKVENGREGEALKYGFLYSSSEEVIIISP